MGGEFKNVFGECIPQRIKPFMVLLRNAFFYAKQSNSDVWEFALEFNQVRDEQVSVSDLRWLVRSGVIDHAQEVTCPGDATRRFATSGNLSFCPKTCFVLTEKGLISLRQLNNHSAPAVLPSSEESTTNGHVRLQQPKVALHPVWDAENRQLRFDGRIVKQFKWKAANQERVLAAFQEEGWPECIDDPLPPSENVNPKRRLHDTIKCLNRNRHNDLIRFHGNGNGQGVIWRVVVHGYRTD